MTESQHPGAAGDTRTRLLDVAAQIMAERGMSGLAVAEVARRAGVSAGAPYRHFRTREHLLAALAERCACQLDQQLEAAVAAAGADSLRRWAAASSCYTGLVINTGAGFDLIHNPELDALASPELELHRAAVMGLLLGLAADTGVPAERAAELLSAQIAGCHGYATLYRQRHGAMVDPAVAAGRAQCACDRAGAAAAALAIGMRAQ